VVDRFIFKEDVLVDAEIRRLERAGDLARLRRYQCRVRGHQRYHIRRVFTEINDKLLLQFITVEAEEYFTVACSFYERLLPKLVELNERMQQCSHCGAPMEVNYHPELVSKLYDYSSPGR
jgi:hypothetical protein